MMKPVLTALTAALSLLAVAQETAPTVSLSLPKSVKAGQEFKAKVKITFADGLHGYSNPPTSEFLNPVKVSVFDKVFALDGAVYPRGEDKEVAGERTRVYEGTIEIELTLRAPKKEGKPTLGIKLNYQQCNDNTCFPPSSLTLRSPVTVAK